MSRRNQPVRDRKTTIESLKAALDGGDTEGTWLLIKEARLDGHKDVADRAYAALQKLFAKLDAERATARAAAKAAANKPIEEGFYTVLLAGGDHRTFKVEDNKPDAEYQPGARMLHLLTGSDNETSYEPIAFVNGSRIFVFHKLRANEVLLLATKALEGNVADASKAFAIRTMRCPRCHKKLSTPCSQASLIGPTCAEEWNVPYIASEVEANKILLARHGAVPTTTDAAAAAAEGE